MMKKLLPFLFALLLPAALCAASFEGKITMKMTGPRNPAPVMTFSVKEGFSRIDTTSGGNDVAIIFDAAKEQMTILMLAQHMFMTQAMPKPAAAGASGIAPDSNVEITTITEKILGYDCLKYVAQGKEGTTEIWVTEQLGAFLGLGGGPMMGGRRGPGGGAPAAQSWEAALAGKAVFPLRVVTSRNGKESFRLEATAIEKQTLPEDTFKVPAGFNDPSSMMRSMGLPGGMKIPGGE